jgi:hypothetical protein
MSYWAEAKFGNLKMLHPQDVHPKSSKKVWWKCDCGEKKLIVVYSVTNGCTTRCGMCSHLSVFGMKFGRWTVVEDVVVSLGSEKSISARCKCGTESVVRVSDLVSGKSTSCGKCFHKAIEWFNSNKELLLSMKTPIPVDSFPGGWLIPKSDILKSNDPFLAVCGACGAEYRPRWNNVRKGKSLTCGCCSARISFGQNQVFEFLKLIGMDDVCLEYEMSGWRYDIAVPSQKFILEYNGLHWHSSDVPEGRDERKRLSAVRAGYDVMMFFDDEWKFSSDKFKQLLKNRFHKNFPTHVGWPGCKVEVVSSFEADTFHNINHCIGGSGSPINYGVFFEEKLVACASFGFPTRQFSYQYELSRMSFDPEISVHGTWSKVIASFVRDFSPCSIVSFSDNRLFYGKVYEEIGFVEDGQVAPGYYWTDGVRRYSKSSMSGNSSETVLCASSSLKKTWDYGKTRWAWKHIA